MLRFPRIALCCTEPGCAWRHFAAGVDEAGAVRCPTHPRKTAVQRNRPYFGRPVETPAIGKLPVVDAASARGRG